MFLFLLLLFLLPSIMTYFSNKMLALKTEEAEFNPKIYIINADMASISFHFSAGNRDSKDWNSRAHKYSLISKFQANERWSQNQDRQFIHE